MGDLMQGGEKDAANCPDCGHSMEWHIRVCGYREPDQKSCPCDRPGSVLSPANPAAEPTQRQWGGDGEGVR